MSLPRALRLVTVLRAPGLTISCTKAIRLARREAEADAEEAPLELGPGVEGPGSCGIWGLKVSFLQFDTGGKETTNIMARIKQPGCDLIN
jgi:hypothetical protein